MKMNLVLAVGIVVSAAVTLHPSPAHTAPSVAGADFSGVWVLLPQHPRGFDPDAGPMEKPPLKAEWMEEWKKTQERKKAGMKIWDPAAHCLPPGMPHTMNGSYPMEILMTPGRVTVLTELFNETRRIWTDGRGHPPADELEYTFIGNSIGHWQGKTLLIDTIGTRPDSVIDVGAIPQSDQMHITERVQLAGKDQLDWTITLDDPVVLAQPWTVTKHFNRAPPDEKVREYVCAENVQHDTYAPSPDDAKYEHFDPRLKTHQ